MKMEKSQRKRDIYVDYKEYYNKDYNTISSEKFTMRPVLNQVEKIENVIQYVFEIISRNENLIYIISNIIILNRNEIVWRNGYSSIPGFVFAWPLSNFFHQLVNQQCCENFIKPNFAVTLIFTFMVLWFSTDAWLHFQELLHQKLWLLTVEGKLSQIHLYDPYYWILRIQFMTTFMPPFHLTQEAALKISTGISALLAITILFLMRLCDRYSIESSSFFQIPSKSGLELDNGTGDGMMINKRNQKMRPKARLTITANKLKNMRLNKML